jgi:hypothetical protein
VLRLVADMVVVDMERLLRVTVAGMEAGTVLLLEDLLYALDFLFRLATLISNDRAMVAGLPRPPIMDLLPELILSS